MKKITLLLVCFISFSSLIQAQEQTATIEELLTRLAEPHTGALSDVFTIEEQLMLQNHLSGRTVVNNPNNGLLRNTANSNFFSTISTGEVGLNGPAGSASFEILGENSNAVVVTHNNSQTIVDELGLTCQTAGITTNNQLAGVFDLATDFGISSAWEIQSVEFGVDEVINAPGDAYPVTVNAYTTSTTDPNGTLTLLGSANTTISSGDALSVVAVPFPAGVIVPAGEILVIELVVLEDFQTGFRLGATDVASNDDSWIRSEPCGLFTFGTYASLGFADRWHVMNVIGEDAGGGGPVMVYGISNGGFELISFDPTDPGTTTVIGTSPVTVNFENAGSVDPNDLNTAYVLDNAGVFYSVDLTTGVYTNLGNIPGGWVGAEFDPTTGILYALDVNTLNLYSIDIAGVSATLIGSAPAGGLPIALAIDDAGNAYTYDLIDDSLYSVDLATGATSAIGFIGFDANFGQGMCWDASTDTFYMSAFNSGSFAGEWRTVDVATGNTTLVGPIITNTTPHQVAWTSIPGQIITSVVENALEGFVIYPNPSSEILNLKAMNTIETVTIFNILGQKVMDMNVDALTSQINVSSFNTGTYIMKVTVNGQTGTYKILKR